MTSGAMAAAVDILLVVLPGSPATKNLIGRPILEALGPDGILVNVGRGSVVNEPALIAALKDGTILADRVIIMTSHPGTFKASIEVDLPRPRRIAELRSDSRFNELFTYLWSILREEVRKAKVSEGLTFRDEDEHDDHSRTLGDESKLVL